MATSPIKKPSTRQPGDPVFSDYQHVANAASVAQLTFAVSLRAENPEDIISRMLPATRFEPKIIAEKKKKPKKAGAGEEKVCARLECGARRDKLSELNSENEELRVRLKAFESRLAASQGKIALTEKSISMGEDKMDSLRGQIEDTQNRILTQEAELEKVDKMNSGLRGVLSKLNQEIDALKAATANVEAETDQVVKVQTSGQNVVFRKSTQPRDVEGELEVLLMEQSFRQSSLKRGGNNGNSNAPTPASPANNSAGQQYNPRTTSASYDSDSD